MISRGKFYSFREFNLLSKKKITGRLPLYLKSALIGHILTWVFNLKTIKNFRFFFFYNNGKVDQHKFLAIVRSAFFTRTVWWLNLLFHGCLFLYFINIIRKCFLLQTLYTTNQQVILTVLDNNFLFLER